ncbi:protein O-linked-mannose beta-1,4-N-acetylglucosaminyltransferase 2-like [Anneissia japonica]|uniref:protein O-linked-mannose beta-1,4-N-acetylglucosaminyltransferase 2-like n=1 Tax=Anneissia japonica TaxID=1529436 RepID=UPI0014255434|nr:protein O-linked-mannose beta-1,4-N-acetylglucosaminyltransferase 2-like [Anneissia japonica]XP_033125309.1 protein O-linked-mannose beta-1,4-N-acetylglucosaminyltransferase 2-like [Anneissia japonica]XP_033125310.1 protein O-linked-mannose beta-1,4-N-acetylglucosaminyltransferase 2-like [Anneissia japonica]
MNGYELIIALGIIGLAFMSYKNKLLNERLTAIDANCSTAMKNVESHPGFIEVDPNILIGGTSGWCRGESNIDRTCKFRHLCYIPRYEEFIFFHGSKTMQSGIPRDRFSPALADLSSVPNHNTQYFNYVDIPVEAILNFDKIFLLQGNSLIFNRFNPSNLMHVFHDDLLPLFHILSELHYDINTSNTRLVLFDGHKELEYFDLYKLFSSQLPLLKHDLNKSGNALVCFEKAFIGLSNETTWYQYGFEKPQGPLSNFRITARTIELFTAYLKSKIGVTSEEFSQNKLNGILIGRQTNRLILNEGELVMELARHLRVSIQLMYLEDVSLVELIRKISSANLLIGIHGSALALSMFLPKGAQLVEIFPYAVNPEHYRPYKTLVSLPGLEISYFAWRNMDKENTVFHRNAPKEFGGIDHLPLEEQNKILSSSEVPLHLCCNDPEWLFRIYQDTTVDVQSFISKLKKAMAEAKSDKGIDASASELYPWKVQEVECKKVTKTADIVSLEVFWQPPWNLKYFMKHEMEIQYEVWIQEAFVDNTKAWILNSTRYIFEGEFVADATYYVWIRCIIINNIGPFSSVSIC